ncbi:MOSC domain-containing protein [Paenibacillus sp. SYP-B3998]|uniref:MOSC domain-containing protein n=1 Tax=Paenibacillus sp. SYP-B3998 TaxID=2678564 RepID=A0A6G3ZUF8_9BACL|nr:MOSC N-terminal beta barrel domain-containing protein [Paenibacillus sp. SYP-B3998]NEW05700.1 MOSC domain-containing protein [Paenibacillus sp. SYP-B3998]
MEKVGTLQSITRYPVKAMGGETLEKCMMHLCGLQGDRSHAFLDLSRPGEYLTANNYPTLFRYTARFDVVKEGQETAERLIVTAPDGQSYEWGDSSLLRRLEQETNRSLGYKSFESNTIGANSEDHILIASESSLREISRLWGQGNMDPRRFRVNWCIALDCDTPFKEETWVGKQIVVGETVLDVNKCCKRCFYVNINPETATIDPSVLKTIVRQRSNCFGVYASVVKKGTNYQSESVYVADALY